MDKIIQGGEIKKKKKRKALGKAKRALVWIVILSILGASNWATWHYTDLLDRAVDAEKDFLDCQNQIGEIIKDEVEETVPSKP